jgi:2-dehydropantoate 2-reductase
MGSVIGGLLARAGSVVTLIDISKAAIDAINANGLKIEDKAGVVETVRLKATDQPGSAGVVDLLLVFVKCYQTEAAVTNALPMIGSHTTVLSLQNGWGNGPRICEDRGRGQVVIGGLLSQRHPCRAGACVARRAKG